jgi:hypothetical protein
MIRSHRTMVPVTKGGNRHEREAGAVPLTRGIIFHAFHSAAREVFGDDGLRAIGVMLPGATRAATVDEAPLALTWYPTTYAVEWYDAVLEAKAAAAGDLTRFHVWLRRATDLGFGRVRRTLLGLFGPEALITRAGELWRHDHTTGALEVTAHDPKTATVVLRDHLFLSTPLAQSAIAEIFRDIISRARGVKRVSESHVMDGESALRVLFEWH